MTWTYSGDPATNARDSIRFLVGDTDTNDQLVSDEEIAWTNSQVTGTDTATTDLYTVAYRVMLAIASILDLIATYFFMAPFVRLAAGRFGERPALFGVRGPVRRTEGGAGVAGAET